MTENTSNSNAIPENVMSFLNKCADIVADNKKFSYLYETKDRIEQCESPIEQLFFVAITTLEEIACHIGYVDIDRYKWAEAGMVISEQCKIDKYRVDFLIRYTQGELIDSQNKIAYPENKSKTIIVELDGHAFHERNEKERRYEKKRDRFLASKGYHVFHFTGSEVVRDPFGVAAECLAFLTGDTKEDLLDALPE